MLKLNRDLLRLIVSMNELLPGVQATDKLLSEMLDDLQCNGHQFKIGELKFRLEGNEYRNECRIVIHHSIDDSYCLLVNKAFERNGKGLLEAIEECRKVAKRYREDGLCECPRKRLKVSQQSHCAVCLIAKTVGGEESSSASTASSTSGTDVDS
jgi:hypothetical protein